MKRLITILLVAASLAGFSQAILIDSYPVANAAIDISIGSTGRYAVGQSFYTDRTFIIDSVIFYGNKVGAPSGNVWINIFEHADTSTYGTTSVPQGDSLCRSDYVNATTFSTSVNKRLYVFSSTNQIKITGPDYYVAHHTFYGYNAANYIQHRRDNTSPSHGGNAIHFNVATMLNAPVANRDDIFYVYGHGLIKNISGKARNNTHKKVAGVAAASIKKIQTLTY